MSKSRGFSGYYKVQNIKKYVGNKHKVFWRSTWERAFCKWCDNNPKVVRWGIEPLTINYYDKGKGKQRTYYPDFFMEMSSGDKYLIEIKPAYETKPPAMKKGTKRYLLAESTFITNTCKWETAEIYCNKKNWSFRVVTEHTMKKMGIRVVSKLPNKLIKKRRKRKKK